MTLVGPRAPGVLRVSCSPIDDPGALQAPWRALDAQGSFFQSWHWIGPLLWSLPAQSRPQLLSVHDGGTLVALALVGRSSQQRRRWIRSRALHLNETGDDEFDNVTVEHNDIVALPGREAEATGALLRELGLRNDWDEFFLGGLGDAAYLRWRQAAAGTGLHHMLRWSKDFHYVDLDAVRGAAGGYLGVLSANARHQIRRSMKLYAQRGALALQPAASLAEALAWQEQMAELHQAHWLARGQPGAFGSDFQRRFHTTLIRQGWAGGAAEIVRVAAGDQVLGYLYNLRKDGTLHNYQTGIAYEADTRLKPGLVCHALAAEDAARRGLARYDLLMGGGHYKQRLATASGTMTWCVFQQRRINLVAENLLRRAAARFSSARAARTVAPEAQEANPAH